MNKAFTKEPDGQDDDDGDGPSLPALPAGTRNYMTPAGYARLRAEFMQLIDVERPKMVETVSWAAENGDRSENGDYLYGKKRLREIDRRIRFLTKRLEVAEVTDPAVHHGGEQVFFGCDLRTVRMLQKGKTKNKWRDRGKENHSRLHTPSIHCDTYHQAR